MGFLRNVFVGVGVGTAAFSAAQTAVVVDRSGGFGLNSPYVQLFNAESMVTFSGKVNGIQVGSPMDGMGQAVTLLVKSPNGGTSVVDLGPAWFINNQPIRIEIGDEVKVMGSKIFIDGRSNILATRVYKGNNLLTVRSATGRPVWIAFAPIEEDWRLNTGFDNAEIIEGSIVRLENWGTGINMTSGMVLRTNGGLLNVDMGPSWFMDRQPIVYSPGMNVTVVTGGGTTRIGNITVTPAYTVVNPSGVIVLRNANGTPFWWGWNRGRR